MLKIVGYPDRYSVAPGEPISFQISLEEGDSYAARVVRVINGDSNPAGPGLDLPHLPSAVDGRYPGKVRRADAGSYLVAEDFPALGQDGAFTFRAMIWPTLLKRPGQVLAAQWDAATQAGFMLAIDDGQLTLVLGDGAGSLKRESVPARMLDRKWYYVTLTLDSVAGRFRLGQIALQTDFGVADGGDIDDALPFAFRPADRPLYLAGAPQADGTIGAHFNGKIEAPGFFEDTQNHGSRIIAYWTSQTASGRRRRPIKVPFAVMRDW